VWVFCLDLEANFLLAGNAAGKMPKHLQLEAGFSPSSSLSGSDTSSKKRAMDEEMTAIKKQREDIDSTLDSVKTFLQEKRFQEKERHQEAGKQQKESRATYLKEVAEYSLLLQNDSVMDTMTPKSKEVYNEALCQERDDVLRKLNSLSKKNE
jgi:hypothetical protein